MHATAAAAAPDGASGTATGDPSRSPPARGDSACSTPFVSAPSSPTYASSLHGACFFSAPTSPTRGGGSPSAILDLGFDFDFSSRFPSPSAAAMSSADELFHNGQIRPVRLAAALLQPHQGPAAPGQDERGRLRARSLRRKARSLSPFRTRWRSSSHVPSEETQPAPAATPAASRSSSSSSTASSASSTSSRGSRRWGGFLKDLLHRSKSDGGKTTLQHQQQHPHAHHAAAPAPLITPPGQRGGRRRSAHERLYEARRAETEEMRRRTSLPYRQGLLLFGCIGLGGRSYGGAAAVSSRS